MDFRFCQRKYNNIKRVKDEGIIVNLNDEISAIISIDEEISIIE